jgi:3-deoxy-D-manno-octulosonic-acid transferase
MTTQLHLITVPRQPERFSPSQLAKVAEFTKNLRKQLTKQKENRHEQKQSNN